MVRGASTVRLALLIYGILNAVLYASLLPLWDGFDEPFHYGYVQTLARQRALPVLGKSHLSEEIWQSFQLAPASHVVKHNLPMVLTFQEYFRLDPAARGQMRARLANLPPVNGNTLSEAGNYEAHQPPLAYAVLAGADLLLQHQPLLVRIWCLRLLCGMAAVAFSCLLAFRLARQLGLPEAACHAALFVVLSSQMFYATTAHVANDWLAVPLFALVVSFTIDLWRNSTLGSALRLALALSAGLLTKSYFLALLPLTFGALLWLAARRRLKLGPALAFTGVVLLVAGPWYLRNLLQYGNLAGIQETQGGVPAGALAAAAWELPWLKSILATARQSLWTGNNSFTSYSVTTTTAMLVLIALGVLLYAWRWGREARWAENLTLAACLSHVAALAYATAAVHWFTKGEAIAPSPWYVQVLLIPGWCLVFLGLSRSGLVGRLTGMAIVWLWAYAILATYFVKLIPFYAGYAEGRIRVGPLARWYGGFAGGSWEILNSTSLAPAALLAPLGACVAGCAVVLAARSCLAKG